MKSSFQIYNASAGSGKTFTIAKSYLKLLVASKDTEAFKHILAITFTNKAVSEMKERIIEMLKLFTKDQILEDAHPMFTAICQELSISPLILHEKSKIILKHIVHNYAAFDISTIDGFTHRIIRTFAFDLKLPLNFEVELDQDTMRSEAVDRLISKAGSDEKLTKVLIDFAIEKADDSKSWDISYDLNKISKLLFNENDYTYINALKEKTLDDFGVLKTALIKKIKHEEAFIIETAETILTLIDEAGLQFDDFNRKSLPNHFMNLKNKRFDVKFDSNWQSDLIESRPLYPKRVTEAIASIIDSIQPEIITAFENTKNAVFKLKFLKAIYKNCTPLSVLNAVNKELDAVKEEQNKVLISEFNAIISKEIADQPTPFIYERLGEKFKHYFIDEFQDTSKMQWQNLIPLIDNAIAGENLEGHKGSLMLVGDAKQSIYRWRGGVAEQFINLYNTTQNPFQVDAEICTLDTNYRSFETIIEFNNNFFDFIAGTYMNSLTYSDLYKAASQLTHKDHTGYVNLNFLDIDNSQNKNEVYTKKVLETINSCIDNGYQHSDICVIVRYKKEGVAIADVLNENNIQVITSETLTVNQSEEVRFINHMLQLIVTPSSYAHKVNVLQYLISLFKIEDSHHFYEQHVHLNLEDFLSSFSVYGVTLDLVTLLQAPLYELIEIIVRDFRLVEASNAYVEFYLDFALEFTQKYTSDINDFIAYFDKKKDTLSITSPKTQDAIQIMTIHKAKGLEFPVVIFPFAELDIYKELEPKEWVELDQDTYYGFSHALLNYSQNFEHFNATCNAIYQSHQTKLELDNINLLYVVLTRAVEQLYIISRNDYSPKKYSGFLKAYLEHINLWDENKLEYSFGNPEREVQPVETIENNNKASRFISTPKEDHNLQILTDSGGLWDTDQENAIERGNLIHTIFSHVHTSHDIDFAINMLVNEGLIKQENVSELKHVVTKIVNHETLHGFFSDQYQVYNEKDIITNDGRILRPDRVVINSDNEAVLIDYKTGYEDYSHHLQLNTYADVLHQMSYSVTKKLLVYVNDDIKVVQLKE